MKVQEANELRNQNRALMEENARSRAFISSNLERRVITSSRKRTKLSMMSRRVSVSGRPPRIASMLAGNDPCAGVSAET